MQTLTGEGTSRKLRRQHDTCSRIEAAAGENAKEKGLANRDLLLAMQSGQLAYRVRAVLDGDRVSEWSSVMMVGEVSKSYLFEGRRGPQLALSTAESHQTTAAGLSASPPRQ